MQTPKKIKKEKSGFTLIELTLAITFISMLFLAIGITTSGIVSAYKKGITIKSVNSLAQNLIDDFTKSIQEAPITNYESLCKKYYPEDSADSEIQASLSACKEDHAYRLIYQQWYANIKINNNDPKLLPVFGAFCTGRNSYVWNTGYTFNGENNSVYKLVNNDGTFGDPPKIEYNSNQIHLTKFLDPDFKICASSMESSYQSASKGTNEDKTLIASQNNIFTLPANGEELISASNLPLALYDFAVFRPNQEIHTKRTIYSSSMILATITGGVDIKSTGNFCTPPSDLELRSDFDYCSVNKFNFTIRAMGN